MEVLNIKNLTKKVGKHYLLKELNLQIEEGQIFGLLGPSGSGKTILFSILLNIVNKSSGNFTWFENKFPRMYKKKIGAFLETPSFYPYLTAIDNLKIVAHIKGCNKDNIGAVLDKVDLYGNRNELFKNFTYGMKQRLAIASTLISNPLVLILDEPTNGIDSQGISKMRNIILEISKSGTTIIMATHLLDEVQKLCSHFCILNKGKNILNGKIDELIYHSIVAEISADNLEHLFDTLNLFEGISKKEIYQDDIVLNLKMGYDLKDINQFCFQNGIILNKLVYQSNILEKNFLKLLNTTDD